jgi:hypothetical protein
MENFDVASEGKDQRQGKQDQDSNTKGSAKIRKSALGSNPAASRLDEDQNNMSSRDFTSAEDIETLQHEELSGSEHDDLASANLSDTDEDENEGLGDGKLGRMSGRGLIK